MAIFKRRIWRRAAGFGFRLGRDERGTTFVSLALATPVVFGLVGLGVETGLWFQTKRDAQTAADAAALAAAYERSNNNLDQITPAAHRESARNGYPNASPNIIAVNNPPTMGTHAGNNSAVEVIIRQPQNRLLSGLFMTTNPDLIVRGVAAVTVKGEACVLALDPSASKAIDIGGSTVTNMDGCVIGANSTSSSAIDVSGSSTLIADSLWTAGGYHSGGSANITLDNPPVTNAWPLPDPYADLTIPSFGGCNHTNASYSNETRTIWPGVYCNGIGFGSNSVITLKPGIYYVNRGNFEVHAQAVINCDCNGANEGVTFVLTSSSSTSQIGRVTINGGATVNIKATSDPSSPFVGLAFVQDRRAPTSGDNKFNGGSGMNITGGVYFPQQEVQWTGNNTTSAPTCTQIIARLVEFTGNSRIDNSGCAALGVKPVQITGAQLVQ